MAELERLTDEEQGLRERLLSIGWHLRQGEDLSAAAVKAAKEVDAGEWAELFGLFETAYRNAREAAATQLMRLAMGQGGWWRPPL